MNTTSYVPLQHMIQIAQQYILMTKGVHVIITPPKDDRELQLLGKAYDIASEKMNISYSFTGF